VALNRYPAESLCSPALERDLQARGENPRDFRRLHRDLIAIFRPGERWEKGGVEALAFVWWKKARRIRGWVCAGEAQCGDLDAQLDELIRLLVLTQSSQHQWWKARLNSVLGYGLRAPEEIRLRIERRLFAFGGWPGKRRYPGKPAQGKAWEAASPYEDVLSQLMADALAGGGSVPPPTGLPSQPIPNTDFPAGARRPRTSHFAVISGRPMGAKSAQTQGS
jgi:hypothetical protein